MRILDTLFFSLSPPSPPPHISSVDSSPPYHTQLSPQTPPYRIRFSLTFLTLSAFSILFPPPPPSSQILTHPPPVSIHSLVIFPSSAICTSTLIFSPSPPSFSLPSSEEITVITPLENHCVVRIPLLFLSSSHFSQSIYHIYSSIYQSVSRITSPSLSLSEIVHRITE